MTTVYDLDCLYSLSQVVLKLRMRGSLRMLLEVLDLSGSHMIEVCHDETLLSVLQG